MGMQMEDTMQDAFAARSELSALACIDGSAGLLLGLYWRADVPRDLVEHAAYIAPDLCGTGPFDTFAEPTDLLAPEALVASDAWIRAYVRVTDQPDLIMVGLARAGTNLVLLRAWLKEVAERVGRAA